MDEKIVDVKEENKEVQPTLTKGNYILDLKLANGTTTRLTVSVEAINILKLADSGILQTTQIK